MKRIECHYDVVVIGGGFSGVCAALASARHGMKTALVQNRPVLGGNASSEIRININGALRNSARFKKDVGEGGILMELLHRNKMRNPAHSYCILDTVLWETVQAEPTLDLYLNTSFTECETVDSTIVSAKAIQITTETEYTFTAKQFIDTSGDAVLAAESGADWTMGREAKSTYNEAHAPDVADHHTMGSTIMFTTKDLGKPVAFKRPSWAYEFTKEKLAKRGIKNLEHGYWWVEIGGDDLSTLEDSETIRDELLKWAFGVFDYIKNSGEYPAAENLTIEWVASVCGKRESRRILGDYVLCENDCYEGARFADAIAYGGWTMDAHSVGGINAKGAEEEGTNWLPIKDIYTIPYRCTYSRNINNLFVGGRAISASHMAMSSSRVIATCAIIGQAIGTAAALCVQKKCTPRALGQNNITELQQTLLRDDCYLPGIATRDAQDLCTTGRCEITASSALENAPANKIANGVTRNAQSEDNAWISQPMRPEGEWIELAFEQATKLGALHVKFDPDFSQILITTDMHSIRAMQPETLPPCLVKAFEIALYSGDTLLHTETVTENEQRFYKLDTRNIPSCTHLRITVLETYGDEHARIFEVRAYPA